MPAYNKFIMPLCSDGLTIGKLQISRDGYICTYPKCLFDDVQPAHG